MANARVELNHDAIHALLRSAEIVADLEQRGRRICEAAGPEDHETQTWVGDNRARVTVRTSTVQGMVDEATTRNLTRAFDAGRD